jgi:hypothetical protein
MISNRSANRQRLVDHEFGDQYQDGPPVALGDDRGGVGRVIPPFITNIIHQ